MHDRSNNPSTDNQFAGGTRHRRQAEKYLEGNRRKIKNPGGAKEYFSESPHAPPGRKNYGAEKEGVRGCFRLCGSDVFTISTSPPLHASAEAGPILYRFRWEGKGPRVGLLFYGGTIGGSSPPEALTIPWGRDGFINVRKGRNEYGPERRW